MFSRAEARPRESWMTPQILGERTYGLMNRVWDTIDADLDRSKKASIVQARGGRETFFLEPSETVAYIVDVNLRNKKRNMRIRCLGNPHATIDLTTLHDKQGEVKGGHISVRTSNSFSRDTESAFNSAIQTFNVLGGL